MFGMMTFEWKAELEWTSPVSHSVSYCVCRAARSLCGDSETWWCAVCTTSLVALCWKCWCSSEHQFMDPTGNHSVYVYKELCGTEFSLKRRWFLRWSRNILLVLNLQIHHHFHTKTCHCSLWWASLIEVKR